MTFPSVAEYQRLKADTLADRNLCKYSIPSQIMKRIEKLVDYYELNRIDRILIYSACYHIGLVDGKREERRRKASLGNR